MKKQFQNLEINIEDRVYSFQSGTKSFKAIANSKHPNQIRFFEYNGKLFNLESVKDPLLFVAEHFLRNEGFTWMSINESTLDDPENDNVFSFPPFEALKTLPEIEEDVEIIYVDGKYDGPISGLIEHREDIYYFNWCMDSMNPDNSKDSEFKKNGRVFALRRLLPEQLAHAREWTKKYNLLSEESRVVNNPDRYPVSDWQKKQLRTEDEIALDFKKLDEESVAWDLLPISAWTTEGGQKQFAAIDTFWLSNEDSEKLSQWQLDVAKALSNEDQPALDKLFASCPIKLRENEIYRYDLPDRIVLRDYRGQPLPEKFWMTSRHSIQDYTYTLKKEENKT